METTLNNVRLLRQGQILKEWWPEVKETFWDTFGIRMRGSKNSLLDPSNRFRNYQLSFRESSKVTAQRTGNIKFLRKRGSQEPLREACPSSQR